MSTHPREEFDGYARVHDLDGWAYVIDGIGGETYGDGPWYPYAGTARLAPDSDYRAWRNEYVTLYPPRSDPARITAWTHLTLRPQGMGAVVLSVRAELDLAAGTTQLSITDLDDALLHQATTKTRRIHELLAVERARRARKPGQRPVTAADLHSRRRRARDHDRR